MELTLITQEEVPDDKVLEAAKALARLVKEHDKDIVLDLRAYSSLVGARQYDVAESADIASPENIGNMARNHINFIGFVRALADMLMNSDVQEIQPCRLYPILATTDPLFTDGGETWVVTAQRQYHVLEL